LLDATLKYAAAKASGEDYDISKWTYTWSSFSCCAVWTWERQTNGQPPVWEETSWRCWTGFLLN
jgi:hypothetical protein